MPNLSPAALTALIKQKALELGFTRVGVVSVEGAVDNVAHRSPDDSAERMPDRLLSELSDGVPNRPLDASPEEAAARSETWAALEKRLGEWLAMGYQAEMAWMVTHFDKRVNPASLMVNTRSIVCVAMNYYTPDAYDPADPAALKIAKYARGTDYHYVVKDRLKDLLAYVQTLVPEAQGRALTDSAPIMEKPLAVNAGLGWMGRNGNVILPGVGSWVFLGEMLLDIPLEPDAAFATNHCGSCRRCIDACPTEAIVRDGVIDANRCLSYWTIEYKGERIPEPIADRMNGWIFGCDICQDVCPWNVKFARPTEEPAFQPRPLNIRPDAEVLLALDEEAFREQFRRSPIKRPKIAGLHRNIRAALSAAGKISSESPVY